MRSARKKELSTPGSTVKNVSRTRHLFQMYLAVLGASFVKTKNDASKTLKIHKNKHIVLQKILQTGIYLQLQLSLNLH